MIQRILSFLIIIILILGIYLFIGKAPTPEKIKWGVVFSQKHEKDLGLDWRESYLAILDELEVKNIRLIAYWDLIEQEEGKYDFEDLDWQIKEAKDRDVAITVVMGMKVPRWPECHIPEWAKGATKEKQQERVLALLEKIVTRYDHI